MGLKVWLPLNGDLHNQGTSSSNISLVSGNTWASSGKIGNNSLTLTKLQTILPTSSCMTGAKEISYCYWVKVNTAWSANWLDGIRWIETDGSATSTARQEFYTNCTLVGTWYKGGSISGKSFTPGVWTHFAGTFNYNTGEAKFYINGVVQGTTTNINTTYYCRGDFYIGDNGTDICENDVRIYDHCLSAAEVKEISQGLVLHYKLDGFFGGAGENLVINGDARNGLTGWANWGTASSRQVVTINNKKWFTFKTDANGNYGGFSQDRGIALYKPNTQYTISALMYASANASGRLWVHTRSTEGGANLNQYLTTVNVTTSPTLYTFTFNTGSNGSYTINKLNLMIGAVNTTSALDFYISNIKVEEGTKATTWLPCKEEGGYDTTKIQDSSGYGHNGTILNTVSISSDTPRYSYSTSLPNANSMINCGRGGMVTDSITMNIWIKSSAWANPVSCTEGGGWNFESSDTCFRFPVYVSGVGYKYGKSTTTKAQICNNEWHMLTGIYDRINQKIQIYVDGQLDNDYATGTSNNIGYHGSNCIWIGAEATGSSTTASNGMSGLFSDFRIYCTPLSEGDIKQLYSLGAKIDNNQNIHTNEFIETSKNLFSSTIWTDGYGNHNPNTRPFLNYNDQGEPIFTTNSTHAGSDYIEINPTNKTYYYDMVLSINAGNQAYIGFHRYDAEKTARSNNATVYIYQTKPSTDIIKKRFTGTVNLSTDGVNPCKYISLRVLNGWSGTTSGVTGTLIIHRFSLREVQNMQYPKITEQSQLITEELDEWNDAKFYQDGIIESNYFIER